MCSCRFWSLLHAADDTDLPFRCRRCAETAAADHLRSCLRVRHAAAGAGRRDGRLTGVLHETMRRACEKTIRRRTKGRQQPRSALPQSQNTCAACTRGFCGNVTPAVSRSRGCGRSCLPAYSWVQNLPAVLIPLLPMGIGARMQYERDNAMLYGENAPFYQLFPLSARQKVLLHMQMRMQAYRAADADRGQRVLRAFGSRPQSAADALRRSVPSASCC